MQELQDASCSGEPWEDTFPLRSKAGEYRWFLCARRSHLSIPPATSCAGSAPAPISALRSQAEEQIRNLNSQLQERVAELEAIMQVLPVGVAVSHDPDGQIVTANLALSNLLGLDPGENIARTPQ